MADILISATLAVLTGVLGYLGVQMTLHPPDTEAKKKRYKLGFGALSIASIGLIVWQGVRNSRAQSELQSDVIQARDEAKSARDQTGQVKADLQTVRSELAAEGTRRQQAERDLATIVQGVGRSTREGVVSDIKQSPINVRVDGSIAPTVPIKIPNITLTWLAEQSTHEDATTCKKLIFQSDIPVEPVALIVTLSAPVKYVDQLIQDAFIGGIGMSKNDNKRLEIAVRRLGSVELLRPDKPISILACSTEDFKPLTMTRALIR